jgi:hypothetical protein
VCLRFDEHLEEGRIALIQESNAWADQVPSSKVTARVPRKLAKELKNSFRPPVSPRHRYGSRIVRNWPRVHCGFCSHPRQRLTVE